MPASARMDKLPPSGTQQYGGATWWRPAVTRVNGTYHAFWVMWEAGRGMKGPDPAPPPGAFANWNLVHYTSSDLKHWSYNQTIRRDSFAYDSDVFRLADGRYILFSTGQTRVVRGNPKVLQSTDLYNWEVCADPELQVDIDEGPHATWNDMTIKWRGFAYVNWDGSAHFGSDRPNMLRTADGGAHWEKSNTTLYPGPGTRHLDLDAAHQGPLLLNQGADGNAGWALYFSEFSVGSEYARTTGCGTSRAVLQLAAVETNAAGWPVVNRSNGPPPDLELTPPPGVTVQPSTSPWSIALSEAVVIVCAEINRWHPGWFAVTAPSELKVAETERATAAAGEEEEKQLQLQRTPEVGRNCSLAGPFYRSDHLPYDGCIASCKSDAQCQGFTWKHVDTPAGRGVAVTVNCTGKAGQPCCYFQTKAAIAGKVAPELLFDCWEKGGLPPPLPPPAPPPPPTPPAPWAGAHSCCCVSCTLPPECKGAGGAGVTPACPSMMWRNPAVARTFFTNASSVGEGSELQWHLEFATKDQTTGRALSYSAVVAANGSILQLANASAGGAAVGPLRQFRYDGVGGE